MPRARMIQTRDSVPTGSKTHDDTGLVLMLAPVVVQLLLQLPRQARLIIQQLAELTNVVVVLRRSPLSIAMWSSGWEEWGGCRT